MTLEASRVSSPPVSEKTLFDNIDTSWSRFSSLSLPDSARSALDSLRGAELTVDASRDLADPTKMIPSLASYVRLATRASSAVTCTTLDALNADSPTCDAAHGDLALALRSTLTRSSDALLNAAGVVVEATAPREYVAVGEAMPVTVTLYNQGKVPVVFESVSLTNALGMASRQPRTIPPDSTAKQELIYNGGLNPTLPWWLRRPRNGDTFQQPLSEMIVGEDRLESSGIETTVRIANVPVPVRSGPIVYRFADPARGEVRRPIATIPEVSLLMQREVEYARANTLLDRTMLVYVHSAASSPRTFTVALNLPAGLKTDSATRTLAHVARIRRCESVFQGARTSGAGTPSGARRCNGQRQAVERRLRTNRVLAHPAAQVLPPSGGAARGGECDVRELEDRICERRGRQRAADARGGSRHCRSSSLDPVSLPQTKLEGFTTIVLGPRAYEANPSLVANNATLLDFAKKGGTLVVQYGQAPYARLGVLPYAFSLTGTGSRVTDEHAAVRVLDPASPLLSGPNKIADVDFANWVQERTSYMPTNVDSHYRTVFSLNDPNEPANDAAVLVAPLGKGTYVYTTFSFFRQLPAGNPGAARLFINLLSATPAAANRPPVPPSAPPRP